jgi:hypothetical protein
MFKHRSGPVRAPKTTPRKLFHGVEIRSRDGIACAALEALEGTRFIAEEAPSVPLALCDRANECRCVYAHYEDRRGGPRRESDAGLPARDWPNDSRHGAGRRVTDG